MQEVRGEGTEHEQILCVCVARGSGEAQTQWHGVVLPGRALRGDMVRRSHDGTASLFQVAHRSQPVEHEVAEQPRLKAAVESAPGHCVIFPSFCVCGLRWRIIDTPSQE